MPDPAPDPTATADDVAACFRLLLGRPPNGEEWTGHVAAAIGRPLPAVVANYLASAEFAARGLARPQDDDVRAVALGACRIYVPTADEAVGRHVAGGVYDPHVATALARRLRPGMGMVDLGANLGVFSLQAAALVGPAGAVLAMEPNPRNARLLAASRLLNGFAHLTVCQAAAGPAIGVAALHSFGSNGTVTAAAEAALLTADTVAVLPVDLLVGANQSVHVIKIDVEGAEHAALLGAERTLRRCRPTILSEFSPGQLQAVSGIDGPTYLHFLQAAGYHLSVLHPSGEETASTPAQVMAAFAASGVDHIDIIATPG